MKFYIAGSDQEKAKALKEIIVKYGHKVTSTWLYDEHFGKPKTVAEKEEAASICIYEIGISDILVLIPEDQLGKGGKFVEAGYAYGLGKDVIIYGDHRENTMMHYLGFHAFDEARFKWWIDV